MYSDIPNIFVIIFEIKWHRITKKKKKKENSKNMVKEKKRTLILIMKKLFFNCLGEKTLRGRVRNARELREGGERKKPAAHVRPSPAVHLPHCLPARVRWGPVSSAASLLMSVRNNGTALTAVIFNAVNFYFLS